jgi:hypothetical protein
MDQRIVVIASALAAFVHCGGQTATDPDTEGPDASGPGSSGSSGGSSSGGGSNGGGSNGGSSSGSSSSGSSSGGSSSGGSSSGGSSSGGSSSGGQDSGSEGGCLRPADAGPRATTPPQHRAQATACTPSASHTACATDGGGQSCTTDADCAQDGGTYNPFSSCLHGQCGIDQCLVDADCASTQVCSCSSEYYGGNSCYHPNLCVPADCHVDSDCGPDGFCSPTAGYCGLVQGFYCHKATDACFDPGIDCSCAGSIGGACVYAPTTGAWVCGSSICAG